MFISHIKIILVFLLITFFSDLVYAKSQWLHSSGNHEGHRFSWHNQINKKNISNLNQKWVFKSKKIDKRNVVQATPIFIDNKIIIVDILGGIYALNPNNGDKVWEVSLNSPVGRRGITSTDGKNPKIYVSTKKSVLELDAKTGQLLKEFKSGLSLLPPIINDNKIFIATLKNGVKAYNLKNSKLIWSYSLELNDIKPRVWSGFSYDRITNSLFVVTSNPGGLYGGNRKGKDLSVSLISIDALSGKKKWHFQHINHDLWDFDLVGNPIIFFSKINGINERVVAALSKTGDIIFLKAKNGNPVFPNDIKKIKVEQSNVEKEKTSLFQYKISKPQPFSGITVDIENDFNHLKETENKKLFNIISNAKSGFYIPPSFKYNLLLFGLHGGAEWPGGSYNINDNSIIIPFNKDPWVIRMEYKDKIFANINKVSKEIYKINSSLNNVYRKVLTFFNFNSNSKIIDVKVETSINNPWEKQTKYNSITKSLFSLVPFSGENKLYKSKCSSCHGIGRQGYYENEFHGDKYVPSLVGYKIKNKAEKHYSYEYLKKMHNDLDIEFNYNKIDIIKLLNTYEKYDNFLNDNNLLEINGFWQKLLDNNGFPASRPPWGGIAKVNMNNGELLWKIPFGHRLDKNENIISKGDINFGGVLSTSSNIFFATGTPDKMARAYSTEDGKLIWERELPFSGSAPPMTYIFKGCQYVVFTATGGQFIGFDKKGDATVAYKLDQCIN